ALSACVVTDPAVTSNGDFTVLSCDQLAVAEATARQQIAALDRADADLARRTLLAGAASDLLAARRDRGCDVVAPITLASTRHGDPAPAAGEAADGPPMEGRFLQVATFAIVDNREKTIARLRAAGLPVIWRPSILRPSEYSRVLVGPLRSREDVRIADAISAELGLLDGFFVNQ
ncbi:MAG: hypothetical protein AAF360_18465, partial [Pseudomonadota bacterium]